jgi:CheY-like chemotaxis protein
MRAAELTRQLLAFGRRQILKPLNLDLNKKVTELLKMVRRVIGEQNGVHFVPGADIGIVRADPVQMDQVIMNLCINSRDAMPDGGTIRIETSDVFIEAGSPHAPALVSPGRYVRLTISDTGSGMTADVMKHLFEPFFTTKEVGKGTGMGLATVYGIIRQHDGYIDCRSAPGKGTTFEILMPTIEQEATATETRVEKPSPRGTETVLVAEDDEAVRRMATRVLESAGYAVITAVDGAEALRKLDAAGDRIAMALLDVVMPNGGGRRVHEVIRLRHPHVRVLFTSGYAADSIHRGFVLEEGLNLIQKPYGAGELLRAVRKVIDASAVN